MNDGEKCCRVRRVAANTLIDGENVYEPGVVEIVCGEVKDCQRLLSETPNTEWLGGTIGIVCDSNGIKRAYKNEKPII